mmetsp:Transcript_29800/g.97090  ORF Transcript_29800/g.97090 Transcript_29800/m.97090 type:complete len:226 (-) Transcript_29800:702-1379(-)
MAGEASSASAASSASWHAGIPIFRRSSGGSFPSASALAIASRPSSSSDIAARASGGRCLRNRLAKSRSHSSISTTSSGSSPAPASPSLGGKVVSTGDASTLTTVSGMVRPRCPAGRSVLLAAKWSARCRSLRLVIVTRSPSMSGYLMASGPAVGNFLLIAARSVAYCTWATGMDTSRASSSSVHTNVSLWLCCCAACCCALCCACAPSMPPFAAALDGCMRFCPR